MQMNILETGLPISCISSLMTVLTCGMWKLTLNLYYWYLVDEIAILM